MITFLQFGGFQRIGVTLFVEWNDESVATFLRGGVQQFVATTALRAGHSRVQLVDTAQLDSEVELLVIAFLKDGFWAFVHCRKRDKEILILQCYNNKDIIC